VEGDVEDRGGAQVTRYRGSLPSADALRAFSAIYHVSFPEIERAPYADLVDSVRAGTRALWMDASETAIAVTKPLGTPARDVLLEYLAVSPSARDRGRGGVLFTHVADRTGGPLVLELEHPAHSDDQHCTRRLGFYRRHGCVPVACAERYAMPVLDQGVTVSTLPLLLYDVAGRRAAPLRGQALRDLVSAIWVESYGCSPDDPALPALLSGLPC
jgi:hypothetical protein